MASESDIVQITPDGGVTKRITQEGTGDVPPAGYEIICACQQRLAWPLAWPAGDGPASIFAHPAGSCMIFVHRPLHGNIPGEW